MTLPLNHSRNAPVQSFLSGGSNNYGNYSSGLSYGSLYDKEGRNLAPIPPPRNQNYSYSHSSPYNSYNVGYSGYNAMYNRPFYNAYAPYRSSYANPIGGPRYYNDGFIEEAHESSREAFASIESIVNAFGSINMMIESTYMALQSSFNAVLSVAENFSRLKSQFSQILSAFTVIRTFQWLYRKFLYLIGLRKTDPTTESAWKLASKSLEESPLGSNSKKSSWPVFMFFVAVYAAPFVMWKFIKSIMQKEKTKDSWTTEGRDCYYAIAKFRYDAQSPEELSFSAGEYLKLAPYDKQADKSWPLASNGKRTGIVPINYIDIKYKSGQSKNTAATKTVASKDEPISATLNSNSLYTEFSKAQTAPTEVLEPSKSSISSRDMPSVHQSLQAEKGNINPATLETIPEAEEGRNDKTALESGSPC